ncbi:tRNA (N(6)-L-threonylcarbamoyladenosine(37)-C(2))-methylthiotransferase MtaB [Wolbachia endosymbiont of Folsomia candida]|uniref:tRNA (N(6)-L-threonylcarbamoyladenosine(37)-C(2))- methylthiotransferase MtaB n=1 Tax=Wolbachia endosymbiont of Folsomia candida TaxID=169402 RepID=UPI000B05EC85|nr:tRNA (N(6)-L-threonylcarbamoyladenosine(37)-C(2))-methylthiotransferase MtaB [Wolbachia endosymbiont of Folsomia candida]APR99117.1 tRNA (N(6)-L-threonylcarbamoyladenosine(37)-C(2))-methylthiotransferase MtaB [Wolbachia endosymbiont of Folsomia candida]
MNEVITFGCRLNFYESELIKEALKKAERENVVVVHSCAVTNEAERQVKQKIRKIYKNDPSKEIIVVGCAVQLDHESYINIPGVSRVLGNKDKLITESYLPSSDKILVNKNTSSKSEPVLLNKFEDKSRAFIEVQNGCNHSCTFCSITEARGDNRSVPINNIIEQIKVFIENHYQEVVFTGVDITDYGVDLFGKPSLGSMIRRVLRDIPELKRLRLSSIDVAEVDDELLDLIINEPRLMPHLHLSLQSGNNLILKRMKRRHNREQVIEFCNKVKSLRPDIAFGADIIAGFPTETDQMFQDTVNLLREANIVYLHAFPYSERKNTPAARMPQVPENVRKERVKHLREINKEMMDNFYQSLVGVEQSVLVEQNCIGRAENFALVKLKSQLPAKSIVQANIIGIENNYLIGSIFP